MKTVVVVGVVIVLGVLTFQYLPSERVSYLDPAASFSAAVTAIASSTDPEPGPPLPPPVTHIATPQAVKAAYMTSCVAATPNIRARVMETLRGTEINSLMIDIKDYSGTLAYASTSVSGPVGRGCMINDLQEFIASLHEEGIYTIARVTVFQDPLYAAAHPELAVQSKSRPGQPWRDRKGLAFIDPNFPAYWKYIMDISREAHSIGFDEINFDYIRFPSDGVMEDAMFATPPGMSRVEVMTQFFAHLQREMAEAGIVTSADIFGQATVNYDDLGIGQVLEDILPYFDYVAPMVYPSHFIKGFMDFDNPAEYPYEVLKFTMSKAVERTATTTSHIYKLRPWLQVFDLGAIYTPEMVHAQMRGVYDAGLTSWMLWDPANTYKKEELALPAKSVEVGEGAQ